MSNNFQYTLNLDPFTLAGEAFPAAQLTFDTQGLGQSAELTGLNLYGDPLGHATNIGNGLYFNIYAADTGVLHWTPGPLELYSLDTILLPVTFPVGDSIQTTVGNNYFVSVRTDALHYYATDVTGSATVHATVPEPAVFGLLVVALALGALVARFRRHAMQE
jgi:hypothetical protein